VIKKIRIFVVGLVAVSQILRNLQAIWELVANHGWATARNSTAANPVRTVEE